MGKATTTSSVKEKSTESKQALENANPTRPAQGASGSTPQSQARREIQLDDKNAIACYANFCRVSGTPEELIIDFGLNPQPFGVPTEPIPVTQRLILNHYTAKRLLHALTVTLQRHEAAFGVLETDVQKRVVPNAIRQASTQ